MINFIKKNKVILILIGIILVSSIWLITKGMPYQHDLEFHYGRLVALARTIKNGDFFALIHDAFYGYGYANGLFYGNFFLYLNAILINLGVDYLTSFKLLYFFINVGTVFSIYLCSKSISKDKKISVIITILYMFAGYRLVDIFVRGALGEMLAFMVIPIIILGLYEIVFRDYKKWYIFTIGFVLLLLSHIITSVLFAVFVVLFILINIKQFIKEKERILYLIISGVVGLGLGAFFVLPILEQRSYDYINIFVNGSSLSVKDFIVSFKELLLPRDFFSLTIGYSLMLVLPIRFFIKKKNVENKNLLKFADSLFVLGIIAWIATTKVFPWVKLDKILNFMQFPWRLLIIATSFISFSYLVYFMILSKDKKKLSKIVLITSYVIISLVSLVLIGAYSVQYGHRKYQYTYYGLNQIAGAEYLPVGIEPKTRLLNYGTYNTNNKDMEIVTYKKKGTSVTIEYKNNNKKDTYIEIPLHNYVGYSVKGAKLATGKNYQIKLLLTDKEGKIKVGYEGTTLTKVSYIVSCITLVGLVVYIEIERKKRKNGTSK